MNLYQLMILIKILNILILDIIILMLKKIYKFELNNDEIDIIRDKKLLLLNTSKDQVHFILIFAKRKK